MDIASLFLLNYYYSDMEVDARLFEQFCYSTRDWVIIPIPKRIVLYVSYKPSLIFIIITFILCYISVLYLLCIYLFIYFKENLLNFILWQLHPTYITLFLQCWNALYSISENKLEPLNNINMQEIRYLYKSKHIQVMAEMPTLHTGHWMWPGSILFKLKDPDMYMI